MHIYIGGAYNGKREYVQRLLTAQEKKDVTWFEGRMPDEIPSSKTIVIAGLEQVIEEKLEEPEEVTVKRIVEQLVDLSQQREVIVIVTDLGRGIVPIEKEKRLLRDICGRLYQQLFQVSTDVTRIWYGIAQPLKKG